MGSTRFPGKVLQDIAGKPMLWHVIDRVQHARRINGIVLATTTLPEDELIVQFAKEYNFPVFRGSAEDVLDRFYQAAKEKQGQYIVRVCGDSPLIDPEIIDKLIQYYAQEKYDYVNNWKVYPEGVHAEVFSFEIMEQAWKEAKKASEREHVTPFLYNNPQRFKTGNLNTDTPFPPIRLVVDHPCDIEVVRAVYARLWKGKVFHLKDICGLYAKEPEIFTANSDIPKLEGYLTSLQKDRRS
jgi:spore coat polysaccharide biosynthesis protein SpsF